MSLSCAPLLPCPWLFSPVLPCPQVSIVSSSVLFTRRVMFTFMFRLSLLFSPFFFHASLVSFFALLAPPPCYDSSPRFSINPHPQEKKPKKRVLRSGGSFINVSIQRFIAEAVCRDVRAHMISSLQMLIQCSGIYIQREEIYQPVWTGNICRKTLCDEIFWKTAILSQSSTMKS